MNGNVFPCTVSSTQLIRLLIYWLTVINQSDIKPVENELLLGAFELCKQARERIQHGIRTVCLWGKSRGCWAVLFVSLAVLLRLFP